MLSRLTDNDQITWLEMGNAPGEKLHVLQDKRNNMSEVCLYKDTQRNSLKMKGIR